MLKKGKKLFAVLLAMCMIFIGVCQVAFAEEPAAGGFGAGDGTNIVENEDEGPGGGDDGQIDDVNSDKDTIDNSKEDNNGSGKSSTDSPEDEKKDDEQDVISKDFSDFLTGFSFYNMITKEEYSKENPVKDGDSIAIRYEFTIPNPEEVEEGSSYVLPALPEQLDLSGINIDYDYSVGKDGYAVWSINAERVITVKFTKALPENNVSGHLEIICSAQVDESKGGTIKFDLGKFPANVDSFDIYQKPEEEKKAIAVEKKGTLNDDNTVTWTITATPDKEDTLAGYTITDTYNKNHLTYVSDSMKMEGQVINDELLNLTDEGFSYTFSDDISEGSHVITYKTTVSDAVWYKVKSSDLDNSATVQNKAALNSADNKAKAEATAQVKVRDTFMQKGKDGEVSWEKRLDEDGNYLLTYKIEVRYGKGNDNFTTAKIVDTINAKLGAEFVTDSVRINYTRDNKAEADAVTPELGTNTEGNPTMTIPLSADHQKAWVYYTIKVLKDNNFNNGSFTGLSIRNIAALWVDDEHKIGGDYEDWSSALGPNDKLIYFAKSGKFSTSEDKNWINWTINVNNGKKDLTNPVTITDTIGDKQKLDEKSISIKYGDEEENGKQASYVIDEKNPNKITFTLKNVGTNSVVITYRTEVTEFRVENGAATTGFTNSATLKYEGIEDQTIRDAKVNVNHSNLLSKKGAFDSTASTYGGKGYFDWTITFNANQYALNDGRITETLPEGHSLVKGSLMVNGEAIKTAVSKTTPYYEMKDGNPIVHFPGTVNASQTITLKTTCDIAEGTENLDVTNNCQAAAKEFKGSLKAKTLVKVNFKPSLDKSTNYKAGNTVNWEIKINKNGANITKQNAVLTDVLPPGLEYQDKSAKLYGADGNEISELTTKYDENTKTLEMKLPAGLDLTKSYAVKFKTDITNNLSGIKNTITFDGSAEEVYATSGSVDLIAGGLDGSISGDNIRLEMTKTDAEDTLKLLPGAEFTLYNEDGKAIGTATSDAAGKLAFDKGLKFGKEYTFKETKSPKGYLLDDTVHTMAIGAVTQIDGQKSAEIMIDDKPFTAYCDSNNTLRITITVFNTAEEDKPIPPPTPTPPTPNPDPLPEPDPAPDPKPLPPDDHLEDPDKPGGDDVVRPELPDDEHLEIDETTSNKNNDGNKVTAEKSNQPQTGDSAQLMLWMILLFTSLSAAVAILTYRKELKK